MANGSEKMAKAVEKGMPLSSNLLSISPRKNADRTLQHLEEALTQQSPGADSAVKVQNEPPQLSYS